MSITFSGTETARVERLVSRLNPAPGEPSFEIDMGHTIGKSFATGEAAAHIGEYAIRPSIVLYSREGSARVRIGTFDSTITRLTFETGVPDRVASRVIDLLNARTSIVIEVPA